LVPDTKNLSYCSLRKLTYSFLLCEATPYGWDLPLLEMLAQRGGLWTRLEIAEHLIDLARRRRVDIAPWAGEKAYSRLLAVYIGRVLLHLIQTRHEGILTYILQMMVRYSPQYALYKRKTELFSIWNSALILAHAFAWANLPPHGAPLPDMVNEILVHIRDKRNWDRDPVSSWEQVPPCFVEIERAYEYIENASNFFGLFCYNNKKSERRR